LDFLIYEENFVFFFISRSSVEIFTGCDGQVVSGSEGGDEETGRR
jgi:hypothetical protein